MPSDEERTDKQDAPGPEGQADGQTQQDAGLDGGGTQAAQDDEERVGTGDEPEDPRDEPEG